MIEKNISFNTLRTSNLATFGNCSTGTGYLFKWDDGNKFYKSGELVYGEFNNHQPIVECLVSDIRNLLNISGVDYSLEVIHSEGNDFFEEQDILCCVSTNFKKANEDYIPFARIYNNTNEILIDNILKDFPQFEEELNLMLILDFIVNNVDRHFNNFGIVKNNKNEEIRFSPIFDNGLSLYSDLNSEQVKSVCEKPYAYKKFDRSKPFLSKHMNQIKLLTCLPKIDLPKNEEFFKLVDNYSSFFNTNRIKAIKLLLERRLEYVRKLYSNV